MSNTSAPIDWPDTVVPAHLRPYYAGIQHGDCAGWLDAIERLPVVTPSAFRLDTDAVKIGRAEDCSPSRRVAIRQQLQRLLPWRKGPFNLFGLSVDAEWRSDMKWRRVQDGISSLSGRTVLDIGCGNGYYGWRMLGAGAKKVVGTDPTLRYVMQQRALAKYLPEAPFDILPWTLEQLVSARDNFGEFDTVFSMGVIYHQRDPVAHIRDALRLLRAGGELALESLIIDERHGALLQPRGRYAQMRNVWAIPSVSTLRDWLSGAGLGDLRVVDVSVTTPAEQRATEWTFSQSLADFLDPDDARLTVEGYPAPRRALVVCQTP